MSDLGGVWRTVGGRRIFIKDGEDLATAMKNSGKFKSKAKEDEYGFKRIGKTAIKIDDMSDDYKRDIEDTLEELNNEFNSNLYGVEYSNKEQKEFGNIHMAQTTGNEYQSKIQFNGFGDKEKFSEMLKDQIKQGNMVDIKEEHYGKYLITHEFGHSISEFNLTKKQNDEIYTMYREYTLKVASLEKEIKNKTNEYLFDTSKINSFNEANELSKELKQIKISNYSMSTPSEFVAEAFTDYRLGKEPKEYSKKVYEYLKEVNKKWD